MWYDWGNVPYTSTTATPTNNPSTTALIAELDSTVLKTNVLVPNQAVNFRITWLVGADTNATFLCETCNSTTIATANIVDQIVLRTPTNQTGQYVTNHQLLKDYRIRVRVQAAIGAGNAYATIQAEPVT